MPERRDNRKLQLQHARDSCRQQAPILWEAEGNVVGHALPARPLEASRGRHLRDLEGEPTWKVSHRKSLWSASVETEKNGWSKPYHDDNYVSMSDESSLLHGPPPLALFDHGLSQDFPVQLQYHISRTSSRTCLQCGGLTGTELCPKKVQFRVFPKTQALNPKPYTINPKP